MKILDQTFFNRATLTVARELLGTKLVRENNGLILSGMVIETEAYLGSNDSASHAYKGQTPRNTVMFGPPGVAYVYFIYGMHYLLNIVTEKVANPCAVLIRAIVPLDGVNQMQTNRGRQGKDLTDGPAKLCKALAIDQSLNGWDLTIGKLLWLETYKAYCAKSICTGPRIGIDYATARDRKAHRRFWVESGF